MIPAEFEYATPTAKLRSRNRSTTQTVARICVSPPSAAKPQNRASSGGTSRPVAAK